MSERMDLKAPAVSWVVMEWAGAGWATLVPVPATFHRRVCQWAEEERSGEGERRAGDAELTTL